jgi:hypothetical protein
METLRESYEAYVIYCFLYFLIALLGEEQQLLNILKAKPENRGHHKFPVNLILSPWVNGYQLLHRCKHGVLQYVVVKNLMAITTFILHQLNYYDEGTFRLDRGYLYVCIINNISQLWALYCLVLFYYATKEELTPWRPISKFVCVKSVVFFTWWQSVMIDIVISLTDFIHPSLSWSGEDIANALQVCCHDTT